MTPFHPITCASLAALLGFAGILSGATAQELSVVRQPSSEMLSAKPSVTAEIGSAFALASQPANSADSKASGEPANPLWAIPLASLAPTRERPIFSPSRRAPVVAPPPPMVQRAPPPPEEKPRKPPFVLLAAIAGEDNEIALFLDETTKIVVRLKLGESRSGWTLSSVRGREATLQGYQQTETLVLPNPLASAALSKP